MIAKPHKRFQMKKLLTVVMRSLTFTTFKNGRVAWMLREIKCIIPWPPFSSTQKEIQSRLCSTDRRFSFMVLRTLQFFRLLGTFSQLPLMEYGSQLDFSFQELSWEELLVDYTRVSFNKLHQQTMIISKKNLSKMH